MTYKLKDGFVLRKVGPMYMAVPFGTRASELKGMVSLSETGYLLWKALHPRVLVRTRPRELQKRQCLCLYKLLLFRLSDDHLRAGKRRV